VLVDRKALAICGAKVRQDFSSRAASYTPSIRGHISLSLMVVTVLVALQNM
jgi:hypothetical protein